MLHTLGYQLVPKFLDKIELLELCNDFKNLPLSTMKIDEFGPSIYNHNIFLEILCKKVNMVSDLIGEPLFPTYCYARKYQYNANLPEHVDRPGCEISLTVHLYGDKEWEFLVRNKDKTSTGFQLNPGDALLYNGIKVPHYRNNYEGLEYSQLFLHYVRSRGQYKDYYFDNKNFFNKQKKEHDKALLKQLSQRYKDKSRD